MERQWTQMTKGEGDFNDINWNCEEQPELEGTLTSVKHNVGVHSQTIYNVVTEDGTIYNVWESAVLKQLLSALQTGTYLKLVYLGKKASKKGFGKYKDFDLFVANGNPAPAPPVPTADPAPPVQEPVLQPVQDVQQAPTQESDDSDEVPF